jgi:phosphatidylinositol glycan class A protein
VYDKVTASSPDDSLLARMRRYHACGVWAGKLFCCIMIALHLWWRLLECLDPAGGRASPHGAYGRLRSRGLRAGVGP